jgi:hypothetical protein
VEVGVDSMSIMRWTILSTYFFLERYGETFKSGAAFKLDFVTLHPVRHLPHTLQALRSLGLNIPIWLRVQLWGFSYDQLSSLMLTNIRFLDIEFTSFRASSEGPTPSIVPRIISALPHLLELGILVQVRNGIPAPEAIPRFTNAPFASLIPAPSSQSWLLLSRDAKLESSIASDKLKENGDFVEELMGFFNLNSMLQTIEVELESLNVG